MSELIKLNDYLYSGDTVHMILKKYARDLKKNAYEDDNQIDILHSEFLIKLTNLLERNNFLRDQADRLTVFYDYLVEKFPYLSFAFSGRIKSLIRTEEKFNGYIVSYIYNYYMKHHDIPSVAELKENIMDFRDLVAYRLTISLPKSYIRNGADHEKAELDLLYEIANDLPAILESIGLVPEPLMTKMGEPDERLAEEVRPFYKDFVKNPTANGYQSLHITSCDKHARCYVEMQLRTMRMDNYAEIGPANHLGYEKRQQLERARRDAIPVGESWVFDEAYERGIALQKLDLSQVKVDMFGALNNILINDKCGLLKGRIIRPHEHLSVYQDDSTLTYDEE